MRPTEKRVTFILGQNGYKLTPQRRAVLGVIVNSQEHFTPADVHWKVREDHPNVGLVTVYRTLEVLSELGLICRVDMGGKAHSYTLAPSGHHHHLVCSHCGIVADFIDCDLEGVERRLARDTGFKIEGHILQFNGLCQSCRGRVSVEQRGMVNDQTGSKRTQ